MKKVLAIIVAIGLILGSGSGLALSAGSGDNPYDDIPWETVAVPRP